MSLSHATPSSSLSLLQASLAISCSLIIPLSLQLGTWPRMEGFLPRRLAHMSRFGCGQSPVVHFIGGLSCYRPVASFKSVSRKPSRSLVTCQNVASEGISFLSWSQAHCSGLSENGPHRLIESGTIGRCGLVGESMSLGGRLWVHWHSLFLLLLQHNICLCATMGSHHAYSGL